ncbi:hypothetical protein E4P42_11180 [Mycobacterium sp. PS03-16]|nr:hypothetical protein E4P42_11180 [Mycobacterium sp. PS03-16]
MVLVSVLGAWHLRTRRHPAWHASCEARFCIASGYGALVIAVYWLTDGAAATTWPWWFGNLWALAACVSFGYGFEGLDAAAHRLAQDIGSLPGRDGRPAQSASA